MDQSQPIVVPVGKTLFVCLYSHKSSKNIWVEVVRFKLPHYNYPKELWLNDEFIGNYMDRFLGVSAELSDAHIAEADLVFRLDESLSDLKNML